MNLKEKKIKTNQLKAGAALSYISMGLGYFISIIYTPIMLSLLGPSEFGHYNLVASVVSYLGLLSFGLGSAYMRYYSRYKVKGDEDNIASLIDKYKAFDQIVYNQYFSGYLWNEIFDNHKIKEYNIRFKNNILICKDMEFVAQYLCIAKNVSVIESKLYVYRKRENSALSSKNLKNKYDKVVVAKIMLSPQYSKYEEFFKRIKYMHFNALFDYAWNA